MRMEFTQHVTHGTCRLLVLGGCRKAQLRHRVKDAALNRFETIAYVGQGPVHDDVHGIIEIGLLGKGRHRQLFYAFIIDFGVIRHVASLNFVLLFNRSGAWALRPPCYPGPTRAH